jgi:hypothetical protein
MKLYTIYDKLAEKAGPVFESVNEHVAKRAVKYALKDAIEITDYQLIELGEIDQKNAVIIGLDTKIIDITNIFNKE